MAAKNGNPFDVDFTKFFENFSAPQFDLDVFAALQKSNIAALGEVGKVASGGFQSIAQRQAEMARDAIEESGKAAQKLATAKPDDRLDASAKLAKTAFDMAFANFQELTDLAVKSQAATLEKLNAIYVKNVDGLQDVKPAAK